MSRAPINNTEAKLERLYLLVDAKVGTSNLKCEKALNFFPLRFDGIRPESHRKDGRKPSALPNNVDQGGQIESRAAARGPTQDQNVFQSVGQQIWRAKASNYFVGVWTRRTRFTHEHVPVCNSGPR